MHKDEATIENLLHEYEARFEKDQSNIKLIKDIAELYTLQKNYYRALEYYHYLGTIDQALDSGIERTIAEVTSKRYDQYIDELDPAAEDYDERKAELQAAKAEFQFDSVRERVRRYPTDMDARMELGQHLHDRKEFDEAIKEFQHVQKFPRLRRRGMLFLARCFAGRGMRDLAINTLRKAIEEKTEIDDDQKELLYTLAEIHEQGGDREDAMKLYKAIFEVDIAYRDVAEKVSSHYD